MQKDLFQYQNLGSSSGKERDEQNHLCWVCTIYFTRLFLSPCTCRELYSHYAQQKQQSSMSTMRYKDWAAIVVNSILVLELHPSRATRYSTSTLIFQAALQFYRYGSSPMSMLMLICMTKAGLLYVDHTLDLNSLLCMCMKHISISNFYPTAPQKYEDTCHQIRHSLGSGYVLRHNHGSEMKGKLLSYDNPSRCTETILCQEVRHESSQTYAFEEKRIACMCQRWTFIACAIAALSQVMM